MSLFFFVFNLFSTNVRFFDLYVVGKEGGGESITVMKKTNFIRIIPQNVFPICYAAIIIHT